jgi:hypothetical protein
MCNQQFFSDCFISSQRLRRLIDAHNTLFHVQFQLSLSNNTKNSRQKSFHIVKLFSLLILNHWIGNFFCFLKRPSYVFLLKRAPGNARKKLTHRPTQAGIQDNMYSSHLGLYCTRDVASIRCLF